MVFHVRLSFLTISLLITLESDFSDAKIHLTWKLYKMHFLAYFILQGEKYFVQCEDNENHMRWMYLTTVLNMGVSLKYVRTSQI